MEDPAGRLARAQAAVEPYPWRRLTPGTLVRHVLNATRQRPADDERHVEEVAAALDGVPWRNLTAEAVCRHLLNALDSHVMNELLFNIEMEWLLDRHS